MISFTNSVYIYNHGRKPRGFGSWAFQYRGKDKKLTELNCPFNHYQDGDFVIVWASDTMTLTEAKKEIKNWFKEHGFNGVISVAP